MKNPKMPERALAKAKKDITLKSDKGADVIFDGTLLASVSNKKEDSSRWIEIDCYETEKEMFVVQKRGCSDNAGEVTKYTVYVCHDAEEVIDNLRYGPLQKSLYEMCGFPHQVRIE